MKQIDDKDIKNFNTEVEYTPEQKKQVQKQFLFVLCVIVFIAICFLIYFVFQKDIRNFFSKDKEIVGEETTEKVKELHQLDDGEIDINNKEIVGLFNIFYYNVNDYFLIDSTKIYKINFSSLTSEEQLFYVSKTKEFMNLINEDDKYLSKENLCREEIIIEKEKLEKIALYKFNVSNINHTDFMTNIEYDNVFLSTISFKYINNKYMGTCSTTPKSKVNVIASNIISSAEKDGDNVYINIKTIFETEQGVFADINLTKKITSDYNKESVLNYYEQGSIYQLHFKYNKNTGYYLEKITLIK